MQWVLLKIRKSSMLNLLTVACLNISNDMRKVFFILLLASIFACNLYAVNPSELIGKPFIFNRFFFTDRKSTGQTDTVYTNLNCFYKFSSSVPLKKLINNNNRYYPSGKVSCPDSIYYHRFVGIDFIDQPKKGSVFIFLDNKGDSVLMTFPKFNPKGEYWSHKNSYSHRSVKSSGNSYSGYSSYVDVTATPLAEWESKVDTILSTRFINFRHPALPIPNYKVLRIHYRKVGMSGYRGYEDYCEMLPSIDLLINDSSITYNADVKRLCASVGELNRKTNVLKDYIEKFDYSNFDSVSSFIHTDVWIDRSLFRNAISSTSNAKNVTTYEINGNVNWALRDDGVLTSAAFGGPTYSFAFAHADTIVLKPSLKNIINKDKIEYEKRSRPNKKIPSSLVDSLEFRYYIAFTRCPDSLYVERNHFTGKIESKYGKEFTDTIFIEFNPTINTKLLTAQGFRQAKNGFYEREQVLWNEFNEEQKAYYKIAEEVWGEKIANIVCRGEVRLGFDEDMCHFAFMRTPYRTSTVQTPIGRAECQDFYEEGVKMYFQNKILIGLEWRGNSLFEPRHRH